MIVYTIIPDFADLLLDKKNSKATSRGLFRHLRGSQYQNGLPVQKLRENYPLNFFLGPI